MSFVAKLVRLSAFSLCFSFAGEAPVTFLLQTKASYSFFQTQSTNQHDEGLVVVSDDRLDLSSDAVSRFLRGPESKGSVASPVRKRATVALAIQALRLSGDFLEIGDQAGEFSLLMANVMMTVSHSTRKMWRYGRFEESEAVVGDSSMREQDVVSQVGLDDEVVSDDPVLEEHPQQSDFDQDLQQRDLDGSEELPLLDDEDSDAPSVSWVSQLVEDSETLGTRDDNVALSGWANSARIHILDEGLDNTSNVERLAFLRIDGDGFDSTMVGLIAFYDKIVPGGFIYVDDYGLAGGSRDAVNEFLGQHSPHVHLHAITEVSGPFEAIWWQKASENADDGDLAAPMLDVAQDLRIGESSPPEEPTLLLPV